MSISNHYRHVNVHEYETEQEDMLRASTDELTARGYAEVLEEDELKVLAQYHLEKFKNYMRPMFNKDDVSSELVIEMP